MEKRLSMARQEIAQWSSYDYLVISSSIEEDLRRMLVIIDAEKLRTTRLDLPVIQGRET